MTNRVFLLALQDKINQKETQCSEYEQKIKGQSWNHFMKQNVYFFNKLLNDFIVADLQNDMNAKLKELKAKSDTISSLGECWKRRSGGERINGWTFKLILLIFSVLQISTLSVEVEQLGNQLQNSVSTSKVEGETI